VKRLEPRQSKELKRRLRDLIDEKKRKLETRAKGMKNIRSGLTQPPAPDSWVELGELCQILQNQEK
jgi:hypothetical protein